jgi:drug/metabolite transporter (DMT)-like permease
MTSELVGLLLLYNEVKLLSPPYQYKPAMPVRYNTASRLLDRGDCSFWVAVANYCDDSGSFDTPSPQSPLPTLEIGQNSTTTAAGTSRRGQVSAKKIYFVYCLTPFSNGRSFSLCAQAPYRQQRQWVSDISALSDETITATVAVETPAVTVSNDDHGTMTSSSLSLRGNSSGTTDTGSPADSLVGVAVLLTVPLAWGTYTPVVKYLYGLNPPVPGLVFSALYYTVAAVSLRVALHYSRSIDGPVQEPRSSGRAADLTFKNNDSLPWRGGLELGLYLFVANVAQLIGLSTVPADRAGFLVQLTTVLVPILQTMTLRETGRGAVSATTWTACLVAWMGVVIIHQDNDFDSSGDSWTQFWTAATTASSEWSPWAMVTSSWMGEGGGISGDAWILAAALIYSLHVVRLERYAQESTALTLATAKATVEAVLSVALVGALVLVGSRSSASLPATDIMSLASSTGQEILQFLSFWTNTANSGSLPVSTWGPVVGAVVWTGWITCAYTIYAQSFGQSRVRPTDANLIYSLQPLCTALFAYGLLGETLGPAGLVGGALIATAVTMVATHTPSEDATGSTISTGDSEPINMMPSSGSATPVDETALAER